MTDDHVTGDDIAPDAVVIERSFPVPVELLWRLWTDPELFAAWYGPVGAKVVVAKMDVRVGGARLVGMEMDTPDGAMRMWFAGEYREVVAHKRIVYTESRSDAAGEALPPSDAGMPDGNPAKTEVTVEFTDLDGCTRQVLTHVGIPADSPGAIGWAMALDKLTAYADDQNDR